jgi:hypothetical protein
VRDGQTWHVVDSDWFDHWKQYTGFDTISECVRYTPAGERPGPIDNSKLIDPEYRDEAAVLTKSLTDGIDYVLLEERTAKLLEEWYGGPGPIIVRKVITVGGPSYASKKKVELYPAFLKLIPCGQDGKPDESKAIVTCVSEKASFSDIQEAQHKAVLQREADEPCIRTPPAEPAGADMSDSTPETSTNAGGVDADMEVSRFSECAHRFVVWELRSRLSSSD